MSDYFINIGLAERGLNKEEAFNLNTPLNKAIPLMSEMITLGQMTLLQNIVRTIRKIRAELNIKSDEKIEIFISSSEDFMVKFIKKYAHYITVFIKNATLTIGQDLEKPANCLSLILFQSIIIYIPNKNTQRFSHKELNKLNKEIERCKQMLDNPAFKTNAPQHKIRETEQRLKTALLQAKIIKEK